MPNFMYVGHCYMSRKKTVPKTFHPHELRQRAAQ